MDPKQRPTAEQARELLAEPGAIRRSRRRTLLLAGAAASVVPLVVAGVVFFSPDSPSPSPAPGAEPPPDQQHSMDPCGQLNAAALRGFGEPKLESDYGDFDHCDVTIRRDQNGIANVQAQLLDKSPEVTSGWLSKKIGAPTVLSGPKTEDSCERIIVLDRPAATQPAAVWCSTGTRRSRCGRANSWRSTAARRCAGSSTGAACAGSGSSTAPTPVPRDCGRPSRC